MYEKLLEENKGLLHYAAHRFSWAVERDPALSFDDLTQAAFFGLVRASESFNASEGKSWAGWALWCIQSEIRGLLRYARCGGTDSLDVPAFEDGEESRLDLVADASLEDFSIGLERQDTRNSVINSALTLLDTFERRAVICVMRME